MTCKLIYLQIQSIFWFSYQCNITLNSYLFTFFLHSLASFLYLHLQLILWALSKKWYEWYFIQGGTFVGGRVWKRYHFCCKFHKTFSIWECFCCSGLQTSRILFFYFDFAMVSWKLCNFWVHTQFWKNKEQYTAYHRDFCYNHLWRQ